MDPKLKLIQHWITLADEKLDVAQELFDLGYFDDATSRAYYGMFYAAKAALLSIDIDTKSHSGVLNQFSQHFIKTQKLDKRYGRMLALVMQARETSDYNPDMSISPENTAGIINDAKSFITHIKAFLNIP